MLKTTFLGEDNSKIKTGEGSSSIQLLVTSR